MNILYHPFHLPLHLLRHHRHIFLYVSLSKHVLSHRMGPPLDQT